MTLPELQRGDLISIDWADIAEVLQESPDKAALAKRTSYGVFWELKECLGLPCLVTTTTIDHPDYLGDSGYCIYPTGCIVDVKVVKRKRRKRVTRICPTTP